MDNLQKEIIQYYKLKKKMILFGNKGFEVAEILTGNFEKRNNHSTQWKALSEGVGHTALFLAKYFRDDEQIVEQENFTLVYSGSFFFGDVRNLIEPTVAN